MPTYVAFLRAINLGAQRRFGKDEVAAATESAGGTEVATYLNTGNVRLTSTRRSASSVATALTKEYANDRGFQVPVIVLTQAEVRAVVETADALIAQHGEPKQLTVTVYAEPPEAAAVAAAEGLNLADRVYVRDRAAFAFLGGGIKNSTLLTRKEFKALGEGTARNLSVLRELAQRWCA